MAVCRAAILAGPNVHSIKSRHPRLTSGSALVLPTGVRTWAACYRCATPAYKNTVEADLVHARRMTWRRNPGIFAVGAWVGNSSMKPFLHRASGCDRARAQRLCAFRGSRARDALLSGTALVGAAVCVSLAVVPAFAVDVSTQAQLDQAVADGAASINVVAGNLALTGAQTFNPARDLSIAAGASLSVAGATNRPSPTSPSERARLAAIPMSAPSTSRAARSALGPGCR